LRSYAPDKAGNKVVAFSSGATDTTNFSTPVVPSSPDGRPTWEFRFQPANAPLSPAGLNKSAQAASKVLFPGARPVAIVLSGQQSAGRRFGVDWDLGDDIGYFVADSYPNEQGVTQRVRAFPGGLKGVGRVLAVERTDRTVTPLFAELEVYQ